MKQILILTIVLLTILVTSCNWTKIDDNPYLEISDSKTITELISIKVIQDAKMYEDIKWSYHPFIKKLFL